MRARPLVAAAWLLLMAIAQVAAVPMLVPARWRPDLMLVLVALYGFLAGPRFGLWVGCTGGLLLDVIGGRFIGLHLLAKGVAGALGGQLTRHVYREHAPVALLLVAVAGVWQELCQLAALRVFGIPVPLGLTFDVLPSFISANLIAGALLYPLLYRQTAQPAVTRREGEERPAGWP